MQVPSCVIAIVSSKWCQQGLCQSCGSEKPAGWFWSELLRPFLLTAICILPCICTTMRLTSTQRTEGHIPHYRSKDNKRKKNTKKIIQRLLIPRQRTESLPDYSCPSVSALSASKWQIDLRYLGGTSSKYCPCQREIKQRFKIENSILIICKILADNQNLVPKSMALWHYA